MVYQGSTLRCHLKWVASLVQWEPLTWAGQVILPAGWAVRVSMADTQSGDVIEAGIAGYKVGLT